MQSLPLLAGLTVLELGDGVAGAAAAGLLAQLGAEVTKAVTTPRRIADHVPAAEDAHGERHGLVASVLDRGKRLVDPVIVDISASAIVIDDRVDATGDDLVVHRRDVAARNRSVWVTVSPYGLDGPHSGRPGGELVAEAAGGLLSTIEPVGGGRPTSPPGFTALRAVGTVAALAALHGLDRFRGTEVPMHVDVSAQEAVIFTGALPECAHLVFRCPGRAGSGRYVAPSGLFPCRDGLVRIAAIEDHQWKGMVACLGAPAWTNGLETRPARAEHAAMITERVREWSAQQLKAECADLLQRNGVPSTPVNGPVELLASPQFASRGFLATDVDGDGVEFTAPGAPWETSIADDATSTPEGSTQPGRLEGTRVLELTHVLAGPIVGSLLGAMGADVVRLEDERRLDIYRRTGPFADGIAGPERGAYFAVANFSKRSVLAAPEDIDDIVTALLERSQVVIENVGRSRLDRLGIDPLAQRDQGRALLHVSGFGSDGPLADYKVYANNVQAYGGLAHLTRTAEGDLAHLGTVLADPLSSVIGATVLAAWTLGPLRSSGVDVDLSMSEVVATLVGEFVAEASLSSDLTMPSGTTLAPYAPHSVFACRDERWLALAVQSDAQWHQLLDVLDHPPQLERPEWSQEAVRWRDRDEIEGVLAALLADHDVEALDATFAGAGVPAAVVNRASDLLADPHLAARAFFPRFEHPDPDVDDARLVGVPWRMVGEGPVVQTPPPRLGSANVELFPQGARS